MQNHEVKTKEGIHTCKKPMKKNYFIVLTNLGEGLIHLQNGFFERRFQRFRTRVTE